ncbi:MAG: TlyA family rRNA (cytidine-2'-O)-methyltransferase [Candidatus Dormibacteraeota bacterium]|nr:TlyA family rRNA (cytidine-2'-O)-methyltransferase [Candidatus Dormibacteraeota bacterium]
MRRPQHAALTVPPRGPLRGEAKLQAALEHFGVDVRGRTALDVGAAAGGFTTVLLRAGAARVYAVDAGHGQLLGSLRQDARVVNLEAINVSRVDAVLVPAAIDVVTIDVSYLSLSQAAAQLDRVRFARHADLIGLVKPMFELRRATAPTDGASVDEAVQRAVAGVSAAGWTVAGAMPSPVTGARGAPEWLLWARRSDRPSENA